MTSHTGSLRSRTAIASVFPRTVIPARAVPAIGRLQALGAPASLVALIVAAALNGLPVRIHGLSVYPEYIALAVVLVWAATATVVERRQWHLPPATFPLAAWLVAELAATLLHAPKLHHSLVLWVKLPMMVAAYILVANLARNRLGQAIAAQGAVAAGVGLCAVLCYLNWKATGSHLGMQQPARNFGMSWLPAVTLREPDILGSYLVAGSLLLLPFAAGLGRAGSRVRLAIGVACLLAVAGTFVSGSRTAWIALIAGIALAGGVALVSNLMHRSRRSRGLGPSDVPQAITPSPHHPVRYRKDPWLGLTGGENGPTTWRVLALRSSEPAEGPSPRLHLARSLAAACGILLVLVVVVGTVAAIHETGMRVVPAFNPNQDGDLLQRVASFGNLTRDHNVVVRVEVAENALTHWQTHALTGWGVGAYGEVYRYPPPDTVHAGWISNLPIHLMYDSGLIGLVAFAAAMVVVAWRGIGAWRRSLDAANRAMVVGILLALFGLLLAFQATDATWFAYPWVYLGLLEAAVLSSPARRVAADLRPEGVA